jgi:hypothetical protein
MPAYNIVVENLDPGCSNDQITNTVVANSCTEYIVRIDPSSTTKGPFNISFNGLQVYTNVSRNQMINGLFLNLACESEPTYLIYASTYDINNTLDTVYYEIPFNDRWGVGNGLSPEHTTSAWEIFINRRINNDDRIINLTTVSGITNPTNIGQQLRLSFPIGSGNTSAILIYPAKYGYISDTGLQEIGNSANVQGLKPLNNNRQSLNISGTSYYIAQITEYQGSEGQQQSWQVISNEI